MVKRKVLVFPAGTEIGLEIYQALRYCKEVTVYGGGQAISNHAKFAYPEYYDLPSIYEADWLEALISLCQLLQIDYIFPAYDDVIVALSQEAHKIPCAVITPVFETCKITRSKSETYRFLSGIIRTPKIYPSEKDVKNYPVFVKPDRGQGSHGVAKVDNEKELITAVQAIQEPLICEYLPGEEYTIDCFSDRESGLLFTGARKRERIRNGISVNTATVVLPEAKEIANKIGTKLSLRGAWFFQLKRAQNDELVLLEVAPRIAGAMAAHRVLGINFPLLNIFETERFPLSLQLLDSKVELDRALCNRYRHSIKFSTLYIDLDDTLLIDNKINTLAIKLIFQCINSGKKVVLLTRHRDNLNQTLNKYRLIGLFDEIILLKENEKKSSYLNNAGNAIFVDDSFAERMDVFKHCNIPTFDCSMIELLTEQSESLIKNS